MQGVHVKDKGSMENHVIMCLVGSEPTSMDCHWPLAAMTMSSQSTLLLYFSMHHVIFLCSLPLLTLTWQFIRESVLTGVVFSHNLLIAGLVYWKLMRHDIHIESII